MVFLHTTLDATRQELYGEVPERVISQGKLLTEKQRLDYRKGFQPDVFRLHSV